MKSPDQPADPSTSPTKEVRHPIVIAGCIAAALAFASPSVASDIAWNLLSFFEPSN